MALKKRATVSAGELGFDMTPMIDVVFQLIIFFLVALSFVESQSQAKLTLPVADQAKPPKQAESELFVFNVLNRNARNAAGAFIFDPNRIYRAMGKNMTLNELRADLDRAAEFSRSKSTVKAVEAAVIVRGDRDAPWYDIIAAMKQCQLAGFTKVYLKALEAELE